MRIIKIVGINVGILFFLLLLSEKVVRVTFPSYTYYKRSFPGQFEDRTTYSEYSCHKCGTIHREETKHIWTDK